MNATVDVLSDVLAERVRQDKKWGEQNHPDGTSGATLAIFTVYARDASAAKRECDRAAKAGTLTWANILFEEVAEALEETDERRLEEELIQVQAVACAWTEAIRRRRGQKPFSIEQYAKRVDEMSWGRDPAV
jgi:hypothetical protein